MISWGLLPITFMDCGFRVVAGGAIVKPLTERFHVAKERLAYMLNNSASPVIVLIPFATTFIGYTTGVINKGMDAAGVEGSSYSVFLSSLPFHFFSYSSILIALLSIIPALNFPSMKALIQENQKEKTKDPFSKSSHFAFEFSKEISDVKENKHKAETAKDQMGVAMKGNKMDRGHMKMGMEHEKPALKPRLMNLIIPIIILLPLSFILMWNSDEPSRMMLLALIITTISSAILYFFQGAQLKKITNHFIKGGNKLMTTIIILALAWSISDLSQDLGLITFGVAPTVIAACTHLSNLAEIACNAM
ncbi:Na+/H+ antiporter NhaC family protein [Cytobacillus oceanisediminis]|uniref:Na+/H+ antiporter family protein n=2 Tax=Cytobacillus oceanisediminis TaxID=665099 RepID=A0A562JCC3_9BACI|nr:Na+/H+ antiporter family protein [Cytobacillus oceanisediminis]